MEAFNGIGAGAWELARGGALEAVRGAAGGVDGMRTRACSGAAEARRTPAPALGRVDLARALGALDGCGGGTVERRFDAARAGAFEGVAGGTADEVRRAELGMIHSMKEAVPRGEDFTNGADGPRPLRGCSSAKRRKRLMTSSAWPGELS